MAFPYTLPGTFPAKGGPDWDVPLLANLNSLAERNQQAESGYGALLDSFAGATDDDKLGNAFSYAAAQTLPPTIVLGNKQYTFSTVRDMYNGMRMVGSLGIGEREFSTTGPLCKVIVNGASFMRVPSAGVKNCWFSGIQFRAGSGSINFLEPVTDLAGGPIIQDATFEKLAWVGFAKVMHARHLRVRIDVTYTNAGTDDQFKLAGSDNYYWQNGGFLSSTTMAASKFYLWFNHMSRTQVGPLYITPEVASGIRIDGSYGNLVFTGTLLDSTGRNASTACQGSAILVTGGRGIVLDKLWFFNNVVNPAAPGRTPQDKGNIYVRGSASDMLIQGCQFAGGAAQTSYTPSGTPAIYADSGVSSIKVVAPIAPAGGTKLIQQAVSGKVQLYAADDWTLSVA